MAPLRGERLDGTAQEAAAARGEIFDIEWPEPHRKWIATVEDTSQSGFTGWGTGQTRATRRCSSGGSPRFSTVRSES
ncbi:hypothetical protein G3I59_43000 [Amycolatopsis rubida]|uniref:Uncharacterized protein n=1 Tax=Amycolatopsis rubida TaxID=112413 RepID=A0ABX0C5X1_9PSEU|nr:MULTISPECIES: hypothetical protein [Amycolatopsis]MYW97210.1 hypothetical protein [Amycolatopsis rubida]NEC62195.1 hypothetical protein [Amycolatopsis rubida]